ncbi:MAG: tRNA 2-selenouridine(34) synthase MnmH [Desulfotomaculaceae bacterium]|nr:tRNA 2-selenouridine(34) synthase MnmH [Desulfotomaculaceae bacterium]
MVEEITIEEALNLKNFILIDVRSEDEFAEATIPGAVNIPVFENEERAAIGTLYHQAGPDPARRLGLKLIAPKLPQKITTVDQLAGDRNLAVFCWRGGQRSQFMAGMLDTMGYHVYRVIGGYKSYRQYVNAYLDREELAQRAVVLHGLTGVGKTEVLVGLEAKGLPALDLEGLAVHRGSVYGKIGLTPSPSQKAFESYIVKFLTNIGENSIFIVECESRRIGNLLVPSPLMTSIRTGIRVLLYAPIDQRVKRIQAVYTSGPGSNIKELQMATASLEKKIGRARVESLNSMLAEGNFNPVFMYLLQRYYDPLYKYPEEPSPNYDLCVDTTDIKKAIDNIVEFVKGLSR